MLIPAFGRYYHITGIRSIRAGLVEVSAHVDVLGTYATEIRELSAIIHRQENSWDLYFNDGILRTRQNPIVYTYPFTTGFSGNSYVFACAGKMN